MGLRDLALGIFAPLAKLLVGTPVGTTYPGRQRRFPEQDGREHALQALRAYVAAVPFADPEKAGASFRMSDRDIHADFAPADQEPRLPAAGVVSAQADLGFEYLGGEIYEEDTLHLYGRDTALVFFGWHAEDVVVELWCANVPQRRSVVAGLKFAFWAQEGRGSVDLRLPGYFDRSARFTLSKAWVIDEPESLKGGRRRALLTLHLQVPEVMLVDAGTMRPIQRLEVTAADGTES